MVEKFASDTVLMTVQAGQHAPTLREAAHTLGVPKKDIDASFGVVPIDEERGLFAVKVRATSAALHGNQDEARGPFSNPEIAPFGPVR